MTLSKESLEQLLIGRPFEYYDTVDSTQNIAMSWLHRGAESGSVVIADEQLQGRGRLGRKWYTPPGVAIAMSVILRPPAKTLSRVTMLGTLAIFDVLSEFEFVNVTIKWPNDVRLNGRKVCGILPETVWQGDQLVGVCLGMGINVRTDFTGTELEGIATSIEYELGMNIDRGQFIATLLRRIDFWEARMGTSEIMGTWRSRLETIGQTITVNGIYGIAVGVDEDGALCVQDDTGVIQRVVAGDVALQ